MVSTRGGKVRFCEGEKVLCYEPDPTKAKVLYESKVLEICVTKDAKKRKSVEYLVHFNGWSNSWDRFVPEEFILKDNDENRALQRRLTEAAAIHLNVKKKKRRLPEIFKEVLNRKKCNEAEADVWKRSDDLINQSSESSSESDSDEEEEETTLINLDIPNALKKQLELDYSLVKLDQKLVKLPREPNIIDILESYIKTYAANTLCATPEKPKGTKSQVNAERNINLCKEVMDGLRIYFDFTLPLVLLFDEEKIQHKYLMSHYKPNCSENDIKVSSSDFVNVDIQEDKPLATYCNNKSPAVPLESAHPTNFSSKSPTRDLSPRSCRSNSNKTPKREIPDDPSESECPKRILRSSANRQDAEVKQEETDVSQTDEEHKTTVGENNDDKLVKGVKGHLPRQCALTAATRLRNRSGASSPPHVAGNSLPAAAHGIDTLPQGVQPPPPLQILSNVSSLSSSSSRSGPPTPTLHSSHGPVEIANSLDATMSWKMIPPKVYSQIPPPPSLIYGAQHLLRLFVKLPEMVKRTNIADRKLDMLLTHLELFLKYLENRKGEFFTEDAYEDMPQEYKPVPVLVETAITNEAPGS